MRYRHVYIPVSWFHVIHYSRNRTLETRSYPSVVVVPLFLVPTSISSVLYIHIVNIQGPSLLRSPHPTQPKKQCSAAWAIQYSYLFKRPPGRYFFYSISISYLESNSIFLRWSITFSDPLKIVAQWSSVSKNLVFC